MKYITNVSVDSHSIKMHRHQSMHRALGYLRGSVLAFIFCVVMCVALQPKAILGHFGLSFYGNFSRTFGPYAIGLLLAAYFLFRACLELRAFSETRGFSIGLQWVAIALLGIVITPSLSNAWLVQDLHVFFGLIVFVTQAVLSLQYLIHVRRGLIDWGLLALQLFAIVGVVLSTRVLNVIPLMLPAQVLAVASFCLLLVRAVNAQIESHSTIIVVENM